MAERKSTRHFNLEKSESRTFDLSKPVEGSTLGTGSSGSSKSKKWPWVALAGVAIVGGCIYFANKSDSNVETTKESPTITSDIAIDSSDSVQQGFTSSNNYSVDSVAEKPEQSDVSSDVEVSSNLKEDEKTIVQQPIASNEPATYSHGISYQTPTGELAEEVINVLRGRYGCGKKRKEMLGERYREIQDKVNEFYRNR